METENGYYIFESSMNSKRKEKFKVVESISTFAHKSFSEQINDNLQYYGMSIKELSVSTRISEFRLSCLLNKNAEFEPREIQLIKRRLHI